MGSEAKKKNWWEDDEIVSEPAKGESNWWDDDAIVEDKPASKFNPDNINVNYEAPAMVRMEVGALEKPEDRLRAVQKHYPDAEPYGDGNFIMSNPENGETMLYNQEGWVPSMGDLASVVPEVVEGVGAGVGGVVGGLGGAAAGSAVPVVGTATGGVAGAMSGAGVGGAAAKDLTQRTINYINGNEDTRTLSEYAKDKAIDVGLNAAGEGAGLAIAKGADVATRPVRKWIAGRAEDAGKATQLAQDFADSGIKPTVGTVTQNPKALIREATLAARDPHSRVALTQAAIDDATSQNFDNALNGLLTSSDPAARPTTVQGAGEGLVTKAKEANAALNQQRNSMYGELDKIVGDAPSGGATNTQELLAALNKEKLGFGDSAKISKGPQIDEAIRHVKAASTDLKKGMTFRDAQDMRSQIGKIAFDPSTDQYQAQHFKNLYEAVTKDMGETARSVSDEAFDKWKQADAFNSSLYGAGSPKEAVKGLTKAQSPEAAYSWMMGKVKQGGTAIKTAREQLERVGGQGSFDQAVNTYMRGIGTHANAMGEEVFSPGKFLQQWKSIAPEAKDEMFAGSARAGYREDLDRLARIVEARQTASKAKPRPNDVANDLLTKTFRVAAAPVRAAQRSYMDRLLSDSRVVKWMTKIPQAQMTRGGIGDHINWLRNLSRESLRAGTEDGQQLSSAIDQYLADSGAKEDENQ